MTAITDRIYDPIETLLNETLVKLQGFVRQDRKWFAEALLDDMGCVYGIGDAAEPIAAIRDVGEGYVAAVALAARRHPERASDAYQAAHGVLVALLDVVQASLREREPRDGDDYWSASSPGT